MSKTTKIIIYIFGIIILIGIFFTLENQRPNKLKYDTSIKIVKNFDDFYTISNCINKYLDYVRQQNAEATMGVLTKRYKDDNRITRENVFDKLSLGNNPTFNIKKVLYKQLGENEYKYKYYVYGLQRDFKLNSTKGYNDSDSTETYYIVYTNELEKIFSLEPYNGEEFLKDGDQNEQNLQ